MTKMGKAKLLDIEVLLVMRTEKAVLVQRDEEDKDPVWLPLSQIEIDDDALGVAEIVIPEWLAMANGLI